MSGIFKEMQIPDVLLRCYRGLDRLETETERERERERASRDTTDGEMATAMCPLHHTRVLNVFWQNPQLECPWWDMSILGGKEQTQIRSTSAAGQFRYSSHPLSLQPMGHCVASKIAATPSIWRRDWFWSWTCRNDVAKVKTNVWSWFHAGDEPVQGEGISQQNSSASPCAINRKVYRKSHRGLLYANSDSKLVRHHSCGNRAHFYQLWSTDT